MGLAPGTRVGHYIVGTSLGAGGMGEVYRATDTRLDRAVALKVLPADLAGSPDRLDRFRREAKALAALDHPNIVTVFSVEEVTTEGGSGPRAIHFLTMQLVDGQSLERAMPSQGWPLERVLQIGAAVADAMEAAHARHIVHRDLKPANVMVAADGRVKVLDFGLAKLGATTGAGEAGRAGEAGGAGRAGDTVGATFLQTSEGVVMGTVPYMSPEQVAGRPLDHRTDIFSLGVMLYELASGRRPFEGASSIELASAILRDTPPLITDVREALPSAFAELIRRCLEKDPNQRVQTAREVADECRDLARRGHEPGAAPSAVRSSAVRASAVVGADTVAPDHGFWILVRPFKSSGPNSDLAELAEGISDAIVTGLSRFSYLRVIARGAGALEGGDGVGARQAEAGVAARYVMEGTLRQAGTKLRLAAQLVDRATGAHLWAETYERTFAADAMFDLQDDLVPRIVSTVADLHGVLPRSMSATVRSRPPEQLSPYEAVLRSFTYFERVTGEELAAARAGLELAVEKAPEYADAWAMLALLCVQDYGQAFNVGADSLARGSAAARRAVEAGPSNHLAFFSLAQALFFEGDLEAFRRAAERAAALNPMDGNSIAFLGELLVYAGDTERGLRLSESAKQLNPHHPWWYWYANYFASYNAGDYRGALEHVLKFNTANHWGAQSATLAVCGQLGEQATGARALRNLLHLRPEFGRSVRADMKKWWDPAAVEHFIDGLRKGGLDVPAPAAAAPSAIDAAPRAAPAAKSSDTAVAIAVLPFADMSPSQDQQYLCEGMAEEIMHALVAVDGIRVASRTSTFRARRDLEDLAAIAQALSVNHVLEGSVRTAGSRLRVTAQLIDVGSGYQLWSNRFDREATDVFAIQDDIATGVVDAVRSRLAPGERAIPHRPQTRNLDAYRLYLKGRHLRGKEDHAGAFEAFEQALRLDPSHAGSWTGLAEITVLSSVFSMMSPSDACRAARAALKKAEALQGPSADGWHVEAFACWIERRWEAMERAWRRALDIEPRHVLALGSFGAVLCTRQRFEEAVPVLERAREADPLASFPYALTGCGYLNCGRLAEAERHLEDALAFDKDDVTALYCLAIAKVALGKATDGIALAERAVTLSHRGGVLVGILGWALATAGRTAEARALLEELRARPAGSPTVVAEAWLLGGLGEIDPAFEVLERAEAECQANLYFTGLPVFDPLRGDPRFAALLDRLSLPVIIEP
jgi:TolB-like protein/Tfp pilus assembly protein PilF